MKVVKWSLLAKHNISKGEGLWNRRGLTTIVGEGKQMRQLQRREMEKKDMIRKRKWEMEGGWRGYEEVLRKGRERKKVGNLVFSICFLKDRVWTLVVTDVRITQSYSLLGQQCNKTRATTQREKQRLQAQ